jgi:hypothetical protein
MASLDIPEILIGMGVVGCIAWAIYNWTHSHANIHK